MIGFDRRRVSRRTLLRSLGALSVAGIVSPLIAACGGSNNSTSTSAAASTTSGSSTAVASASTGGSGTPAASAATSGSPSAGGSPVAAASAQATSAPPPPGTKGGQVTVAQSSDATSMDPAHTTATVDSQIYSSIYNRLLGLDDKSNVVPELAVSWETAADNLSWTFKLREGVKFHDGTDFNADAVKATIERYLDPAQNSPRAGEIPYVTGVDAVDTYTAKVNLKQAFVTLLYSFAGTTGTMVSPTAVQKFGQDYARNPVGTGPFVFKEWIKNDHVTATRNENYWKQGLPYLDSVSYKGISDPTVILNGIKANDIQATYGIAAKDVATVKNDPSMQLVLKPSTSVSSLRLNNAVAPFDKKEIRQAISWAIDRAAIEKALYFDTGVPVNSFLGPQNLGYDKDITLYAKRDLDKAKQLLSAGGQPNGFSFDAQTTNSSESLKLAQAIKSQLEDIKVTMNLQLLDGVTLLQKLVDKQFQASFVTYNGGIEPFQGFNRFFYSKSTIDVYGYNSPAFDALLLKAASTADQDARLALYKQLTDMLSEDCPWVFLRAPAQTQLFRKEISGYVFNPDGVLHLETVSIKS
ncbi:MAG TPA: ABC transporter substrate-binding protein [Nitrolancea sp.]